MNRNSLGKFIKGHSTNFGRKCSKDTRLKIGKAHLGNTYSLGKKRSKESRLRMSLSKRGKFKVKNPSYGSVHTWLLRWHKNSKKECRRCGSRRFLEWALKKGKKHSHNLNNYFILCSSCHKRYDYTDERKKKLSKSLKKVIHTKEWGQKISIALKGRKMSEEAKNKISIFNKLHPRKRNKYGKFYKL